MKTETGKQVQDTPWRIVSRALQEEDICETRIKSFHSWQEAEEFLDKHPEDNIYAYHKDCIYLPVMEMGMLFGKGYKSYKEMLQEKTK